MKTVHVILDSEVLCLTCCMDYLSIADNRYLQSNKRRVASQAIAVSVFYVLTVDYHVIDVNT